MARITFQPGFHFNPNPMMPFSPLGTFRLNNNTKPPTMAHDKGIVYDPFGMPINPIGVFKITD